MMPRRSWLAAVVGLTAATATFLPAGAAGPEVGAPPHVTIVSSLPLTFMPELAVPVRNAIEMAINDAGGKVKGVRVDYLSLDDGSPAGGWPGEVSNANRAASEASTVAYLGPLNSSAAMHSIPILCAAGLAMVSPSTTRDSLTKAVPINTPGEPAVYYPGCPRNFARVIQRDGVDGEVAASKAAALGSRRAFVIGSGAQDYDAYGFVAGAPAAGLAIVGTALASSDSAPFANLRAAVAASGADVVYTTCFYPTPCPSLVRTLRSDLPGVRFLITDGGLRAFPVTEADDGLLDVREFVSPAVYPPAAAAWYTRYSAIYGKVPGDEFNAAIYAYDATRVILAAIAASRPHLDRASVRRAVMSTTAFDGLLGRFTFDADGDTSLSTVSVAEVVAGAWSEVGTESLP